MPSPSLWISRFLRKPENAFLCVVDDSFIRDRFNLTGLSELVPEYELARQIVLDETDDGKPTCTGRGGKSKSAAELFYGLVHARFVMTLPGIEKMFKKYKAGCFGYCPRINCERWNVLPIGAGLSTIAGQNTVRLYCPRCMDAYVPMAGKIGALVDGAYFGTSFPQMMFMIQPEIKPPQSKDRYVAKLYGFRVHNSANRIHQHTTNEYKSSPSCNQIDKTMREPL